MGVPHWRARQVQGTWQGGNPELCPSSPSLPSPAHGLGRELAPPRCQERFVSPDSLPTLAC